MKARKTIVQIETFGADVCIEANAHAAPLVFDRPAPRNAIGRPMANALADAFERFETNAHWHAAVLFGAGGTFCAGADLISLSDDSRCTNSTRTAADRVHSARHA